MTILITVLLTLLAIILIACVTVVLLAPMRITLRFEKKTAIDIDFGRYMKNMWAGTYWFSITKVFFDNKGEEVEYADMFFNLFEANKKQIAELNRKLDIERMEEEMEYIDHE